MLQMKICNEFECVTEKLENIKNSEITSREIAKKKNSLCAQYLTIQLENGFSLY